MTKRLAILGSTGSIGKQCLEIVDAHPNLFEVKVLTANNNAQLLINQALKYHPSKVIIANRDKYALVKSALEPAKIQVFSGSEALESCVSDSSVDMVVAAMVGYAGLIPVINAIKAKKQVALANKETLVVAGDLITRLCREYSVDLLPVDSEHSAIFQCLQGEDHASIEKLILTCSGGPFRGYSADDLSKVTPAQALAHPNWDMGNKITIDSATLMNKGFEVIEARWLFDIEPSKIEVVVHPQSIIHSLVQFCDGSIKAQIGLPDMRLPIQYAMCFPQRKPNAFPRFSFLEHPQLSFIAPDIKIFRNLALAYFALEKGGNMACIMNAANEIVVQAFLDCKIGFHAIAEIIEQTMAKSSFIVAPSIDDYIQTDIEARKIAQKLISKK